MKFSRLLVLFGVFVIVQFAVMQWTAQADPNPNCTMACAPPNGVCIGTNSTPSCPYCYPAGWSSCSGVKTEWFNNVTNGSTMGSSTIEFHPLLQEDYALPQ